MENTTKFFSDPIIKENHVPEENVEDFKFVSDYIEDSVESINDFFETEKALKWIRENAFKRVALQFPDCHLKWAFQIAHFLEEKSESKIYILGDSSYRSCCVDKVSAEHANCDSLIHFGDACLSSSIPENFPILYIFCRFNLDLRDFKSQMNSDTIRDFLMDENVLNIALLYDSSFSHSAEMIRKVVERDVLDGSKNFIVCDVVGNNPNLDQNQFDIVLGRNVDKNIKNWTDSAILIFVGLDSSPLLPIWLMTFVQFTNIIHYTPKEKKTKIIKSSSLIRLRKRLFLIEKLRDANTVGLVVGTLAVAGFKETIQRVRQLCKVAQKKLYVFSIGKINEAKLSNFASDIDAFILISCPFGVILNTGEYYKPILSLFEAEISLNPDKNWYAGSGWTAQIGDFLSDKIGVFDAEEVDVSLLSGRIRCKQNLNDDKNNKNKDVIQYSAGDYFANRSWKGLDDQYHQEKIDTKLRQGLEGIASGYTTEKNT